MVRAFSHPDPAVAALVRNALDEAGIESVLRNDAYGAALGEVPPLAAWAEVWVADRARLDEATAIARASTADGPEADPWTCPVCGETVEGPFGACWNCGAPAP